MRQFNPFGPYPAAGRGLGFVFPEAFATSLIGPVASIFGFKSSAEKAADAAKKAQGLALRQQRLALRQQQQSIEAEREASARRERLLITAGILGFAGLVGGGIILSKALKKRKRGRR